MAQQQQQQQQQLTVGGYYLANHLVGFATSSVRVKLLATHSDGSVSVITASLTDAGTQLLLSAQQLTSIGEEVR